VGVKLLPEIEYMKISIMCQGGSMRIMVSAKLWGNTNEFGIIWDKNGGKSISHRYLAIQYLVHCGFGLLHMYNLKLFFLI
jgi:hypothetical protein